MVAARALPQVQGYLDQVQQLVPVSGGSVPLQLSGTQEPLCDADAPVCALGQGRGDGSCSAASSAYPIVSPSRPDNHPGPLTCPASFPFLDSRAPPVGVIVASAPVS